MDIETIEKVVESPFLSIEAKQLYLHILYTTEKKGSNSEVNLDRDLCMLELTLSKTKLNNSLSELKNFGLIKVGRGGSKKITLQDITAIPIINNTKEIIELVEKLYAGGIDTNSLINALNKCREKYFRAKQEGLLFNTEDITMEFEDDMTNTPVSGIFTLDEGIESEALGGKKKKKFLRYMDIPVEQWNTNHFCDYFSDMYYKIYDVPYVITSADRGTMKRLIEQRDKDIIREYIDTYMTLDFFEVRTIKGFASSFVQSVIDNYMRTGNLPNSRGYKKQESTNKKVDSTYNDIFS